MTPLQRKAFEAFQDLWRSGRLSRPRAHVYLEARYGKVPYFKELSDQQAKMVLELLEPNTIYEWLTMRGKQTGVCQVCGQDLTDPKSVAKGIGPVCEGKFGALASLLN